jgi:hypothetical protein
MPRREELTRHAELKELKGRFEGARHALVTTQIIPHERNDRPGRECPCCGSTQAWGHSALDDLSVLIDRDTGKRHNRWKQQSGDGSLALYDSRAAKAQPWGTEGALTWHCPITYRCTEAQVDALTDDTSEVLLFSGGWRSGKTYLSDSWWTRGWVKFGGRGEIFWLISPFLIRTWKNMRKIFFGKESDAPILPMHNGVPILGHGFPEKHTSSHMHFEMIDQSRVELYHASQASHLEGDDVRRIQFDEAARVRHPDAFQVCRGRVAQSMGAVGLATVPDDEGPWIYDEIVQPFEQGISSGARVVYINSYDNVFVANEAIARLEKGTNDPKVVEEKIHGRWTMKGAFAYGDVFSDAHAIDTNSHEPEAWGFKHDCTRAATKGLWGPNGVDYIGGADSNWRPQTALIGKIFGDIEHPATWTLCMLDEMVLDGDTQMAATKLAGLHGGKYRGKTGLIPDGNMFRDANYHGGSANQSNDAAEYKRLGFRVAPPIRIDGTKASNPNVLEARKLVRIMLRENKLLFSEVGCPSLIAALPKVPSRPKAPGDAGTYMDRKVYNFDDSLRYVCWKFFSKRLLPKPAPPMIGVAS